MSLKSSISLINLSKQFPFDIDETLKKQICFGETLIVSCGHIQGDLIDSECSTSNSSDSGDVKETEDLRPCEIKEQIDEDVSVATSDDENNFQFYFFPDCTKPVEAANSQSSLIIKDGMPQMNPEKSQDVPKCTCEIDKIGRCKCYIAIPCKCGAKMTSECECSKLNEICVCNDGELDLTCSCKEKDVCMCHPDGIPRPVCTCGQVNKPCICHPGKFPYPVCICEHKPKTRVQKVYNYEAGECFPEESSLLSSKSPCDCQEPDPILECLCEEETKCMICNRDPCECHVQHICACDPIKDPNGQGVGDPEEKCSCPDSQECTCQPKIDATCKCFPVKNECTCGNPENCKCFHVCECTDPCICDTEREHEIECTCASDDRVNRNRGEGKKLKRVRAGKHGYQWCHDVDPRHTYFGYGYGRHDKIDYKMGEEKKIIISDAKHDEAPPEISREEKTGVPIYNKKLGKLSLDCCSAVGGVTINVETLGEDKGKFLVQVVSHSSKEGAKTGSKFVSIVDCRLHTLEENRTEYIHKDDKFKEKRNYMAICESGYYNKVTRICGDRHLIKRFYHTFEEAHDFLLEGANIVLMRYVGLTRYKGCIKTDTVLIDGVICENVYVCLGVSHAVVNGRQFFVEKVERHIIEPTGKISQTLLVLTLKGYVVSQEWARNSYVIHINPLLRVIPERDEIEPHEPLRETWREDLQLLSDYLEFKAKRSSEGARYVSENGELTGTIRDYLQALLLLRPNDALHFTRHYFGAALSALDLPHNEFFDSSTKHVRYYFFEE